MSEKTYSVRFHCSGQGVMVLHYPYAVAEGNAPRMRKILDLMAEHAHLFEDNRRALAETYTEPHRQKQAARINWDQASVRFQNEYRIGADRNNEALKKACEAAKRADTRVRKLEAAFLESVKRWGAEEYLNDA